METWKNKRIWGLVGQLNMSSEDLHAMVLGIFGEDSLKALTEKQADKLIAELERRLPAPAQKDDDCITEPQRRKIWRLMGAIEEIDPTIPQCGEDAQHAVIRRLGGICNKTLGREKGTKFFILRLKKADARTLIDALVRYLNHIKRKRAGQSAGGGGTDG